MVGFDEGSQSDVEDNIDHGCSVSRVKANSFITLHIGA
jgi:hypothetical protein